MLMFIWGLPLDKSEADKIRSKIISELFPSELWIKLENSTGGITWLVSREMPVYVMVTDHPDLPINTGLRISLHTLCNLEWSIVSCFIDYINQVVEKYKGWFEGCET